MTAEIQTGLKVREDTAEKGQLNQDLKMRGSESGRGSSRCSGSEV